MLIPTNNTELIKAAATLRFKVLTFTAYLLSNPVAPRAVVQNEEATLSHNKQDERHNHFLTLPSASHQILAGNSEYTSYTSKVIERVCSAWLTRYGQNCSPKICNGDIHAETEGTGMI